jgi:hypothetical protein
VKYRYRSPVALHGDLDTACGNLAQVEISRHMPGRPGIASQITLDSPFQRVFDRTRVPWVLVEIGDDLDAIS